jgi:uncharacterized protein (DUF2336 family)
VASLIAMTPEGHNDELRRLTALAHAMFAFGEEHEKLAIARAVARRDDVDINFLQTLIDKDEIAAAIIVRYSPLLNEEQLAAVVQKRPAFQKALAERDNLPASVAQSLINDADEDVLLALILNKSVRAES